MDDEQIEEEHEDVKKLKMLKKSNEAIREYIITNPDESNHDLFEAFEENRILISKLEESFNASNK